ncbi:MAG: M15 family metallopeptidase [Suilimivivens sp.]
MKKWLQPLGVLLILIVFCAVIAQKFSGSETLSEYAEKNPEIAYATAQPKEPPTSDSDTVSEPMNDSTPEPEPTAEPSPSPSILAAEESADSVHYEDGFFYQPLTDSVIARITGISYPVSETIAPLLSLDAVNVMPEDEIDTLAISYDALRYMNVLYYDFNGEIQTGELICNKGIAQDLVEIFYELYRNEYQIEKIRLIDEYGGDDTASMEDNNTSCFNYRVVDGTTSLSKHALGCAIDINPFYNPYIVFDKTGSGNDYISPEGSEIYVDRSQNFPYKIDENDLCYKLFKEHGFTWGGDWNSCKDYQHFQKVVD